MTDNKLVVRGVVHDLNNELMVLLIGLERMMDRYPNEDDAKKSLAAAQNCVELTRRLETDIPTQ